MAQRATRADDPAAPPGDATPGFAAVGFDYELPAERIAQAPAPEREAARLLLVPRGRDAGFADAQVRDLPRYLTRGDLLVVNRSRVIPARLHARRLPGGGAVELLLLAPCVPPGDVPAERARRGDLAAPARWRALARPAKRLHVGQCLEILAPGHGRARNALAEATVAAIGEGSIEIEFGAEADVPALLTACGEMPLPPYIRRPDGPTAEDTERYQTVFALEPGSVAAPTAGLHLTERLLGELRHAGVSVAEVVLHVGPATFLAGQPGRAALAVEPERYLIPPATRQQIAAVRGRGRVVAVGTTTTRALESAARAGWPEGWQTTDLVLAPGAKFEVIDALMTNFHLPGSSLLALVSAFAGTACARAAYAAALQGGYRFYSFGDAMLIHGGAC